MERDLEKQCEISSSAATSKLRSTSHDTTNSKFEWRDISYSVDTKAGKKQILQNVSGCVETGT